MTEPQPAVADPNGVDFNQLVDRIAGEFAAENAALRVNRAILATQLEQARARIAELEEAQGK